MKSLGEYVVEDYARRGVYPHVDVFTSLISENLKPGMQVAELGVFDGATTRINLPLIKPVNGLYYAVDWFMGTDESVYGVDHGNLEAMAGIRHYYRTDYDQFIYPLFLKHIEETGCADVCKVLKGKTSEMCHLIPDDSLDICFIDAAHDYASVIEDIKLYKPKVKAGGILCGHDYDADHQDVIQAVNESFEKFELRKCINNVPPVWVVRI